MSVEILTGDVIERLQQLPDDSFDSVITSPPYWGLRDYGVAGQLGLEPTLAEHLDAMVRVFDEVWRVLKPSGSLWLNYGDCYATTPNGRSAAECNATGNDDRTFRDKPFSTVGPIYGALPGEPHKPANGSDRRGGGNASAGPVYRAEYEKTSRAGSSANKGSVSAAHGGRVVAGGYLKPKDLCMIPNRLAIALQDAGWWVRSEIIWGKPNAMPDSSGRYRPATAHEKIFLLAKSDVPEFWVARDTGEISAAPDLTERCAMITTGALGPRWIALGHFYNAEAVKVEAAPASVARWAQDIGGQAGSTRQPGKTNGPMKAVGGPSRIKMPDGWHTGPGAHGSVHPAGREKGKTIEKVRGLTPRHEGGVNHQSLDGFPRGEGRLLRNYEPAPLPVWRMATAAFREAHFATFPPELVERCLRAGCPPGGKVLDPFGGAGTTGLVADALGYDCTLIEINPDYAALAERRIAAARCGPSMRAAFREQAEDLGPLFEGGVQ